jgi:hypothetical protein
MAGLRYERLSSVVRRLWSNGAWTVWLLAAVSTTIYLGASLSGGSLGFPLDDAWIHQTYARSLGTRGEFAFLPGRPSAGSTSPLWSGLIALGYLLRLEPRAWTYALGAACLGLNAWLAYCLVLELWPQDGPDRRTARRTAAVFAGAAVALEWHLAWASASGMETLLFSALALAVFGLPVERSAWLGAVAGASVFVRPDGLTLLPFALARAVLAGPRRWRRMAGCLMGFAAVFVPYLAFNYALGGSIWPNTFYAKQAEYAVARVFPLPARLFWICDPLTRQCQPGVGVLPFLGAQVLLLPGIAAAVWEAVRLRRWERLVPPAWAAAFVGAYVLRLPVTYQYGRYVMPVIPVLVALGVGAMSGLLRLRAGVFWPRVLSRAWAAAFGALALAFWGLGATLYRRDVRIIETEMVAAARWIDANTEPGAIVAAHDVGALGYFGGREILDLAGLISADVIPFIRDEARLRDWLTESGADYLMTFPGWYPDLALALAGRELFRTGAPFSPAAGGENMVVYRWP